MKKQGIILALAVVLLFAGCTDASVNTSREVVPTPVAPRQETQPLPTVETPPAELEQVPEDSAPKYIPLTEPLPVVQPPITVPVVPPTEQVAPAPTSIPEPSPSQGCCKICLKGKACGNSCISRSYTCHQPPGCACDG